MKDCALKSSPPDLSHPAAPVLSRAHPSPDMVLHSGESR